MLKPTDVQKIIEKYLPKQQVTLEVLLAFYKIYELGVSHGRSLKESSLEIAK